MSEPSNSALRFGVLGAANIARQFIAGVAPSSMATIHGVASRDAAKAEAFARETGVARHYGSYEAMLADPEVEAVYNPLPNSLHAPWSIRAAEAGKHVLCEKPLALSAVEARAMFDAARANRVVLREAYPYMAQPQTVAMRRLLAENAVGRPQYVQATIGFSLSDPANVRFDPALGGGAVLDAGSYPVSLVRIALGRAPARVSAMARFHGPGVDRTLLGTLDFADGTLAQVACSFSSGNHRHGLIAGDDGVLETTFMNHLRGGSLCLQIKRSKASTAPTETVDEGGGDGFQLEAESFTRLVRGDAAAWTGATEGESVDIAATIDALRRSAARDGAWTEVTG